VIQLYGKEILTSIEELADPAHAALIVVDVQNDCCARDGAFAKQGADLTLYREMIPRLAALLESARQAGVLVIFIQATTLPGGLGQSPAQILFEVRMKESYSHATADAFDFCRPGTWGHAIVDELAPRADELIIQKQRSSAFVGTNLDLVLRSNGIKTIVVSGVTTEGCVDSTIRDGGFLDYYPLAVEDCVASDNGELHEAALTILHAYRAVVVGSDELRAVWGSTAALGEARQQAVQGQL
jgi:nicotinamidase-related amidase